jgi:hypothetical protein
MQEYGNESNFENKKKIAKLMNELDQAKADIL